MYNYLKSFILPLSVLSCLLTLIWLVNGNTNNIFTDTSIIISLFSLFIVSVFVGRINKVLLLLVAMLALSSTVNAQEYKTSTVVHINGDTLRYEYERTYNLISEEVYVKSGIASLSKDIETKYNNVKNVEIYYPYGAIYINKKDNSYNTLGQNFTHIQGCLVFIQDYISIVYNYKLNESYKKYITFEDKEHDIKLSIDSTMIGPDLNLIYGSANYSLTINRHHYVEHIFTQSEENNYQILDTIGGDTYKIIFNARGSKIISVELSIYDNDSSKEYYLKRVEKQYTNRP